ARRATPYETIRHQPLSRSRPSRPRTVPVRSARRINHHSPRDKSEPGPEERTPEAEKNPRGTGGNFLGCSNLWRPQPPAAAALRGGSFSSGGAGGVGGAHQGGLDVRGAQRSRAVDAGGGGPMPA